MTNLPRVFQNTEDMQLFKQILPHINVVKNRTGPAPVKHQLIGAPRNHGRVGLGRGVAATGAHDAVALSCGKVEPGEVVEGRLGERAAPEYVHDVVEDTRTLVEPEIIIRK